MCHVIREKQFKRFLQEPNHVGRVIGRKRFKIRKQRIVPPYQGDKPYRTFPTTEGLWIGAPLRPQIIQFNVPLVCTWRDQIGFHRIVCTGIHVSWLSSPDEFPYPTEELFNIWHTPVWINTGEFLFYDGEDASVVKVLVPWRHVPEYLRPKVVYEMRLDDLLRVDVTEGDRTDEALRYLKRTNWRDTLVQAFLRGTWWSRTSYEIRIFKVDKRITKPDWGQLCAT